MEWCKEYQNQGCRKYSRTFTTGHHLPIEFHICTLMQNIQQKIWRDLGRPSVKKSQKSLASDRLSCWKINHVAQPYSRGHDEIHKVQSCSEESINSWGILVIMVIHKIWVEKIENCVPCVFGEFLIWFYIFYKIGKVKGELKIFPTHFICQDLRFFVPGTYW